MEAETTMISKAMFCHYFNMKYTSICVCIYLK